MTRIREEEDCLYRAISRAMYGKEDMHALVRLMTAVEIAVHTHEYNPAYPQFSINLDQYPTPYSDTLQAACRLGSAAEMLHLYAASAAIGRPLQSYCPLQQSPFQPLNRIILGRNVQTHVPPVKLMWTSAQMRPNVTDFIPNHFIVMHEIANASTIQPLPCLAIQRLPPTDARDDCDGDDQAERQQAGNVCYRQQVDDCITADMEDGDDAGEAPSLPAVSEFRVFKGATQRGKDLLVSMDGFSYTRKVCDVPNLAHSSEISLFKLYRVQD